MTNYKIAQSLLRVLKNFSRQGLSTAIRKVPIEQMYKECKNKSNYYII